MPVESDTCRIVREVTAAAGRFAPGHLGALTRIVPFEMVDAVLAGARRVQWRVRDLPSRVVVYLLLAAALFEDCGYRQVWARLVAALDGLPVAHPSPSALAAARRRVGVAPLRTLFDLLCGPATGPATRGVRWHGRLLLALDGTSLCCADTPANLAVYRKGGGHRNDVTQLVPLVDAVPPIRGRRGRPRRRPRELFADRGYDHDIYRRQLRADLLSPATARSEMSS